MFRHGMPSFPQLVLYSIFMSAYNEVEYRQEEKNREEEGNTAKNEEMMKKKLPSYTRHGNGTVMRFEQFVTDLVSGPRSHGLFDGYKMWGVQVRCIVHKGA